MNKKNFNIKTFIYLFVFFMFLINIKILPSYSIENKQMKVAIIPFKNLSDEQKYDWIGNGFAETMVSTLITIKNIQIVERFLMNDVLKEISFQQSGFVDEDTTLKIGKMTGANVVISGSYQILNKEIAINARFINIEKATAEEAFYMKGKLSEIFYLQEKLAKRFSEIFNIKLSSQDEKNIKTVVYSTNSINAHELYLKAKELTINGGFNGKKEAITLLEKAVEVDPNYSLAWAFLGEVYLRYTNDLKFVNVLVKDTSKDYLTEIQEKGTKALEKAISLSPNLHETYRALATGYYELGQKEKARRFINKALELKPNDVENLLFMTNFEELNIIEYINKANKIDPYSYKVQLKYGMYYLFSVKTGTQEENSKLAVKYLLKSIDLNKYSWLANIQLVYAYMSLNKLDEAVAWSQRVLLMEGDVISNAMASSVYLGTGIFDKVRKLYQELDKKIDSPYIKSTIAQFYILEEDYQNAYKVSREALNKYSDDPNLNACMSKIYLNYFKNCKLALYHYKVFLDNYDKQPFVDKDLKKKQQEEYNRQKNLCKQK